jgi:hypothetical protein
MTEKRDVKKDAQRIKKQYSDLKALWEQFRLAIEKAEQTGDLTEAKELMVQLVAKRDALQMYLLDAKLRALDRKLRSLSLVELEAENFTRKSRGGMKTKIAISTICGLIAVVHLLWPRVQIDMVTLVLLLVAMLPWLASVIRSVELPGGFKIELQDVKAATEKITAARAATETVQPAPPVREQGLYFLRELAKTDPNLALVGFRIEIEKRLSQLAQQMNLPATRRPAVALLRELVAQGTIDLRTAGGLADIIALGNQAAHGAEVSSNAAVWALDTGPLILALLDSLVARRANAEVG